MLYRTLDVTYQGSINTARIARKQLRQHIEDVWGIPLTIAVEDLLMAVHEAVSNSWRHGSQQTPGRPIRMVAICVELPELNGRKAAHKITVAISDTGEGFDTSAPLRVEMLDGEGNEVHACGRFLMSKGCDSVEYCRQDGWFTCILEKTLPTFRAE